MLVLTKQSLTSSYPKDLLSDLAGGRFLRLCIAGWRLVYLDYQSEGLRNKSAPRGTFSRITGCSDIKLASFMTPFAKLAGPWIVIVKSHFVPFSI